MKIPPCAIWRPLNIISPIFIDDKRFLHFFQTKNTTKKKPKNHCMYDCEIQTSVHVETLWPGMSLSSFWLKDASSFFWTTLTVPYTVNIQPLENPPSSPSSQWGNFLNEIFALEKIKNPTTLYKSLFSAAIKNVYNYLLYMGVLTGIHKSCPAPP